MYTKTHAHKGYGNVLSNNFEALKVSLPEHKPVYVNLEFKIIKSEFDPNVRNSV